MDLDLPAEDKKLLLLQLGTLQDDMYDKRFKYVWQTSPMAFYGYFHVYFHGIFCTVLNLSLTCKATMCNRVWSDLFLKMKTI